jgi:hypothetical protein
MFDKKNPNYKLYLAGVISESQYMDLCELGQVDPFSKAMNPTTKALETQPPGVITGDDPEVDEKKEQLRLGAAKTGYDMFLKNLRDMSAKSSIALLNDFLPQFLSHTKVQDGTIKTMMLTALTQRK